MPRPELPRSRASALTTPFLDFWLLGGASIVIYCVMALAQQFRGDSVSIERHFAEIVGACALLSIIISYPHFIMSYKIGYGNGFRQIRKYPFSLVGVPALLIGVYAFAYLSYDSQIFEYPLLTKLHYHALLAGWDLGLEGTNLLGPALVGLSMWVMNVTVGWHYAKQTYGCMLVYAKFGSYPLTERQRLLVRSSVLALSFFFFVDFSVRFLDGSGGPIGGTKTGLGSMVIPIWIWYVSAALVAVTTLLVAGAVFLANYLQHRKLPPANFLVPWVALFFWWTPPIFLKDYYLLMIPLFHSVQYLTFAMRREIAGLPRKRRDLNLGLRILALLVVGYFTFEFLPQWLDDSTAASGKPLFFVSAIIVFLNVHHYFIDSVSWRFDRPELRSTMLERPERRKQAA